MFKTKKKSRREVTRIVEYMISGGVWFWSGYILIVLLDNHIGLFWANFIGNAVGITLNFLLQRYWVFNNPSLAKHRINVTGRYVIYTALNAFLLNYLILYALKKWFGIDPKISQFIASGFFTIWNYFWYKFWVFPEKKHRVVRHGH